jgi:hypothetical protein
MYLAINFLHSLSAGTCLLIVQRPHIFYPCRILTREHQEAKKSSWGREDFLLDGMLMKHVVLRNVTIFYSGAPVVLEDVTFVNCTFVLTNTEGARNFALAVLASAKTIFNRRATQL